MAFLEPLVTGSLAFSSSLRGIILANMRYGRHPFGFGLLFGVFVCQGPGLGIVSWFGFRQSGPELGQTRPIFRFLLKLA